jgi:ParB-like chromosome segregation protein Spo0J
LRASIERFGVLMPVTFDQRGRMIDGHHRWRIASELGTDCPWGVRHVADDEEAAELARTLNMDRRHLDPALRCTVAAALRRDGHNLRAIAAALGVDASTVLLDVRRRVADATGPDFVLGRDNKVYRPTRPGLRDLPPAMVKPDLGGGVSHPRASAPRSSLCFCRVCSATSNGRP